MHNQPPVANDFLDKINSLIEANIANEQFGVSELADQMGMSRSNLLRKIKGQTRLSVSQLIRQVRLQKALKLLQHSPANVSEVAYQVGFSSPSYFIKCFREFYGYSPGEVGKRGVQEVANIAVTEKRKDRRLLMLGSAVLTLLIAGATFFFYKSAPSVSAPLEKSIAVLPFKNDSNDSTNVYLINGLMEATLNNLQKIKDLKVISRTSSEKYRNTAKTIPEMARELNVSYFVEGSGQKIGNKILLNIQLIEAGSDKHLWARQYRRETTEIFELQQEIAKNIAAEIQAIITPEESERIDKVPTTDLAAYDLYLQGLDLLTTGGRVNLLNALPFFEKALSLDDEFALAYANTAITYYYLDFFQKEKKYTDEINKIADKALLADPKLPESLIAKALYFMHINQFNQAVPYLEKALEYNPNSVYAIYMLSDFYAHYHPNTAKYLEYALKGVQLDAALKDSVTTSYTYLTLSNALIQSGFVDEAVYYINKSLDYFSENPYSSYVKSYIMYTQHNDLSQTKAGLLKEWMKDTNRIDVLQDIGKVSYYMRDYKEAYKYYKKLIDFRKTNNSNAYRHENALIGMVMAKTGRKQLADEYFADYSDFLKTDQSMYNSLGWAGYYAYLGDTKKSLENLEVFTQQDYFQYWVLLFFEKDPIFDDMKDLPEFKRLVGEMKKRFWTNHEQLKESLMEKGLL